MGHWSTGVVCDTYSLLNSKNSGKSPKKMSDLPLKLGGRSLSFIK